MGETDVRESSVRGTKSSAGENYILPFLWMRGEAPEILRNEMAKIHEAGIHAVCLESRPHPDFAGERWWHDVDIIIEEAKKYGMQIWILDDSHFPTGAANNKMPEHPDKARRFLVSQFVDVTGPVPAAQVDVSLLMTKQITWMDLGKKQEKPLYDYERLLSVTAYRVEEGDTADGVPVDLTEDVRDGYLTWDVPAGVWRIVVTFDTTAFGGSPDYINYIDSDSVQVLIDEVYEKHYAHYKDLFGTTIAGFFSDEPGFYNVAHGAGNAIGQRMPLPWGREMEESLKKAYGPTLYRDMPLLFFAEKDGREEPVRTAYMECVSRLYSKNFSRKLGDWCRAHGVQYIGHVVEDEFGYMRLGPGCGHYFRAMAGQDMAGIDNIGYQLMPGNDRAVRHTGFQDLDPGFYHYGLGRLGASEAAIDPAKKGRLMCENFGAYGWRLGVRDMKWLVDYLVGQGVNHFVPHAFSMAEYPDADCPPHFYARGMNPEFPYFCRLMRYTDRLCRTFSDGAGIVQAGVLFEAEADWAGKTMPGWQVGKQLIQHQVDFLFLPSDVLEDDTLCRTEAGSFSVNGRQMKILIVPACGYLPRRAAVFIAAHPEVPVIYVDRYPARIAGKQAQDDEQALVERARAGRDCVPLEDLAGYLAAHGVRDEIHIDREEPDLHIYRYEKGGKRICHLMNVSLSKTVDVQLTLPGEHWTVYDAMNDRRYALDTTGGTTHLVLPPYGAAVLERDETAEKTLPRYVLQSPEGREIPLTSFDLTLHEIGKKDAEVIPDFAPVPVSNIRRDFSGVMEYRAEFHLEKVPEKAVFAAEHVYECMSVTVNGKDAGAVLTPPYAVDITAALKEGDNEIVILAASTPLRNANTKPGIFGKERAVLEPTGMFGKVKIVLSDEK